MSVFFVETFSVIFRIWRLDFKDDTRNNYELYDFLNRKKVFTRPFYINFWSGVGKLSTSFYILGFLMYTTRTWVSIMSILPICWYILPLCFDNKVFYYCSISFQLSIYPHSFSINDCIKKCHVRSIRATYTHIQNLYSASLYYTVVQNFMHFDWAKLYIFLGINWPNQEKNL